MAKKKILGIEIGNYRLKIAVCSDYNLERLITAEIPDNIVRDDEIISWEAMADFIKEVANDNKITYKHVAMTLPENLTYVKNITMPAMSVDQLRVNLPYEFHDYITEDKDKYFYDYSVIHNTFDEEGTLIEMELMAVATLKSTVNQYKTLCRRAGLRLSLIAPEFCGIRNIIKDYEECKNITEEMGNDYAVLDLGHRAARLYFFTKGEYEVTRIMEPGCKEINRYIADSLGIDDHIAQIYKETNKDNILNDQGCLEIYGQMAVEVMRVLNFYNFNHPDNKLKTMYYCGGGARIKPLIDAIEEAVELQLESIEQLLMDKYEDIDTLITGPKALGITWE